MKKCSMLFIMTAVINVYCYSQVTSGFVPRYTDNYGKHANSIIFQETEKTYGAQRLGFGTNNIQGMYHFSSVNPVYPAIVVENIVKGNEFPSSGILFQLNDSRFQSKISYKSLYESDLMQKMYEKPEDIGFLSFEVMDPKEKKLKEVMKITDSGYLGLGVEKPETKLHVYTESSTAAIFENIHGQFQIAMNEDRSTLRSVIKTKGMSIETYNTGSNAINSNQLFLSETGNIAIGHSSPSSKLDISSNSTNLAKFTNSRFRTTLELKNTQNTNSITSNATLNIGNINSMSFLEISDNSINVSSGQFCMELNPNTDLPSITGLGYILGSFSYIDKTKIEIYHNNHWGGIRNRINNKGFEITTTNNNGSLNSNQLYLSPDGNVGIRTSSPSTSFEIVDGTFKLSGTQSRDGENARFVMNMEASTSHNFMELKNDNGTQFRILGNGTVIAKEVNIQSDFPTPDYVFEENYNLMSINELEEFISENKHLPNIPSADEVSKNGMNIAELSNLLLEKIEELTLYTIEQHKLIEMLIKKTTEQEKMIEELNNENNK